MEPRLGIIANRTLPIPFLLEAYELTDKKELPEAMGIYFIFDSNGVLLYVGQSTNIKRRIQQHTAKHKQGSLYISKKYFSLEEAKTISYILTDNLEEVAMSELYYIETYAPKYNPDNTII